MKNPILQASKDEEARNDRCNDDDSEVVQGFEKQYRNPWG